MRKILITGSSGRVGQCVFSALSAMEQYEIIGGDLKPCSAPNSFYMDMADYNSCLELMKGTDTVIHLAYQLKADTLSDAFAVNYLGMYHLYEAARECGVKRVIFGSSNHVTGRYPATDSVDVDSPYRPSNLYGLSKCHGELLGRLYADKFGISSFNIRIGTFSQTPPKTARQLRTWISGRDMVQLIRCCIEADPQIDYMVMYGVSGNKHKYWDIGYLERLIGYKPLDDGGQYEEEVLHSTDPDELLYQGGYSAFRKSL